MELSKCRVTPFLPAGRLHKREEFSSIDLEEKISPSPSLVINIEHPK
jgi:hypothetical protein